MKKRKPPAGSDGRRLYFCKEIFLYKNILNALFLNIIFLVAGFILHLLDPFLPPGYGNGILIPDKGVPHGDGVDLHGHEETVFLLEFCFKFPQFASEGIEAYDDVEFSCEIPDHTEHLEGIKQVDDENGVIHNEPNMEETEFYHTGQKFGHGFMQENVVSSADQSPEKGVEGADDTAIVKPVVGVIPKADVHTNNEDPAGNQLD